MSSASPPRAPDPASSLVDGVDHVYVPMVEAAAAFAVLTERLQLPALWPFQSFGTFSRGGVSVGSIKLEVIEANASAPWCTAQEPPQIQGIAFRPARRVDDGYLAEVDARSMARTEPERFERDGEPAWTNVYFSDLVSDAAGAFVCDYYLPESRDVERRRRVLHECDGGRLGVLDAAELVIVSTDVPAAQERWQRLLGRPRSAAPPTWQPPLGPAITVRPGDAERVDHLALSVRDVEAAHRSWDTLTTPLLVGFPLRFLPG